MKAIIHIAPYSAISMVMFLQQLCTCHMRVHLIKQYKHLLQLFLPILQKDDIVKDKQLLSVSLIKVHDLFYSAF